MSSKTSLELDIEILDLVSDFSSYLSTILIDNLLNSFSKLFNSSTSILAILFISSSSIISILLLFSSIISFIALFFIFRSFFSLT